MISHRHRAIFVHIPKCGGQSVEQAFLDDLGLSWSQRAPLLLGRNPSKGMGPPRLAHLSAADYTRHHFVTDEMWSRYFTFAVVRGPVARAVSMFNHLRPVENLQTFIHDWLPAEFARAPAYRTPGHDNPGKYHFVRPQSDFITGADDRILVDRIVRLEDLATAWPEIQSHATLASALPHRNASEPYATPRDLTRHDLDRIAALYARDFDMFGYEIDAHGAAGRSPMRKPSLRRFLTTLGKHA